MSSGCEYIIDHVKYFLDHKLRTTRKKNQLYFFKNTQDNMCKLTLPLVKREIQTQKLLSGKKGQKSHHIINHRKYNKKIG